MTITQHRQNLKHPGAWETWESHDNGKSFIMTDDGWPEEEDTFPLSHKYGWTERGPDGIFHFQVANPDSYYEGCRGRVTGPKGQSDGNE